MGTGRGCRTLSWRTTTNGKWLERTVQPQDSVSRCGEEEEPMVRANHGASDMSTRKQLWKRAQIQTDKDGKPRIPIQPSIKEATDVESLAAKRRGVSAECKQQQRESSRHQTLEKKRESRCIEEWDQKVAKMCKRGKRSAEAVAKPYHPCPIKLSRRYKALEKVSELEDDRSVRSNTTFQWCISNG